MANDKVIKTILELSGEGTYKNKLDQVAKALKMVNSTQKVVDAQYSKEDKSLAALAARQSVYQDKLEAQKRKLEIIREEYEKVAAAEGETSDAALSLQKEMNYATAQVVKTEKSLKSVEDTMQQMAEAAEKVEDKSEDAADAQEKMGDAAEAVARKERELGKSAKSTADDLEKAKNKAEAQKKALKEMGEQAEKAAGKMSKALTAATASAVTISAKGYMDFESEMSNVATLADTTAVSMDELSKQALEASNRTGVAATEIAQGAYTALSSGVDTANAMSYITEASKAAKAGQSDLNTVVEGSTSIINAWKLSYSDATSVFEKMLVAQDKGKTTLGELSSQIGQITGIAPQLNISLDETLAAVAALTKNGVQTSSAITGLRAVMSNVLKPTSEAAEAAKKLGLEFNVAALQSKGLTGFLKDVLDKTGGSAEELAKLFGSVEGLSQIMLLGGSAAEDYADALDAMNGSAGRLDEAFSIVTDNSAARLNMSLNKLKNNAIEFGQTLAPYIDMGANALENLSEKISAMSQEEQKNLLEMALWTAAGLKAISMLSKMVTTIKMMGTAAGPVGLTVTALTALTAAIVAANKAAEANSLEKTWERLSEKANANISGNMNAIITATVDTTSAEETLLASIKGIYQNVSDKLTDGEADTPTVVNQLKADIASLFAEANSNLEGLGTEAGTYAEQLKTLEAQTVAWINGMAGQSTEYVLEHLGELALIQAAVEQVIADMNEANSNVRNEGKDAYKLAQGGATTNQETIAQGAGWAYRNRELDLQDIKEEAAAQLAEADKAYAEGLTTAEEHLQAEEAINAWSEGKTQEAEQLYAARMSGLLKGVTQAFASKEPETVAEIQGIFEKQKIREMLQEQFDALLDFEGIANGTVDKEKAVETIKSIYDQYKDVFNFENKDYDPSIWPTDAAQDMIMELNKQINGGLKNINTEDLGFYDTLNELLSSDAGAALNIDTTNMEEVFKAAMGDVGVAGIEGMELGIQNSEDKVETATGNVANASIGAAKSVLKEKSPSRVFYEIGQNTIQGMINGVNSKQAALVARMRAIARAAANAVKQELDIHSPSGVMETLGGYTADGFIKGIDNKLDVVERSMRGMVSTRGIRTLGGGNAPEGQTTKQSARQTTVNVKYTGAFTRREAQRFGREFALQIAADNAGKGG